MNSAWTPAVRPSEARHLPQHARLGSGPLPVDDDTQPLALVPRQREAEPPPAVAYTQPETEPPAAVGYAQPETEQSGTVAYALPETPPRGLRKFDLGSVPASVTPPRSWRKAAWFAVGTSAAVVCGLAVAAGRFVGTSPETNTIDALPAFPTQQLPIDQLPIDETNPTTSRTSSSPSSEQETPTGSNTARRTSEAPVPGAPVPGSSPDADTAAPGSSSGESGTTGSTSTVPTDPPRSTVGPAAVTPTNPQAMGDRTEQYFALVTEDPQAAHQMCTGGMAREGPAGIEARYEDVDRVEVQSMTIDRNQGTTTSVVKVVHEDGTAAIEERQLTFTWGSDPKISDDTTG